MTSNARRYNEHTGLHRSSFDRDGCGVGFVADASGAQSNLILNLGLEALGNLTHRGAVSSDGRSGDGAGILTRIPVNLMNEELNKLGVDRTFKEVGDFAVGVLFLPQEDSELSTAMALIEKLLEANRLEFLAWRPVPVNEDALGQLAVSSMPQIWQLLIGRPPGMDDISFDRALYLCRKDIEKTALETGIEDLYVPSMSSKTLVYKGLLIATQLARFYKDLSRPEYETSLAVFHQRYSTNTLPNWFLAQPLRLLGHNGEINTLQGNRHWIRAREPELTSNFWGDDVNRLLPIIQAGGSDSAQFDNVLELLVASGRGLLESISMMIPEAWENMPNLDEQLGAFYKYNSCLTEPWDGPAAMAFSDGMVVGGALDRNGLRPARYKITSNNLVLMASEVGVIDFPIQDVIEAGRLGPGHMIAVDVQNKRILRNAELKQEISTRKPYNKWIEDHMVSLRDHMVPTSNTQNPDSADVILQKLYGYTSEEMTLLLQPMVAESKEPVGSMGDDTPLAVLTTKPRLLYSYFKQKFAQVTNPPIDPIREQIVMSLHTYLGSRRSLLEETPGHASLIFSPSPIITDEELLGIKKYNNSLFNSITIDCLFPVKGSAEALQEAIRSICQLAAQEVESGRNLLILSDRKVDQDWVPIPMLLITGAVHHYLINQGLRMRCSIIVETGEAREMHHMACLIGYGAAAVNPYLAFSTVRTMSQSDQGEVLTPEQGLANYRTTLDKQILKILSKMGISTLSGYHGAQIFDAIGISQDVVDVCFTGTTTQIGGIGFVEIARESLDRHERAYRQEWNRLDDFGYYRFRKDGEPRGFSPVNVRGFQKALTPDGTKQDYVDYVERLKGTGPLSIRDLLGINPLGPPISLDKIEPATEIVKRFTTGSMSLGALSPEAHETLAIATNRIGAKSNTGEGGEDPRRYHEKLDNGDSANAASKQVASGRFGVTTEYLAMARELEIKMAQGSKPGEGGQLPGHKVLDHIARLRHTQPGVPLISPPPHHDIYSIEDLAQLIYDLKVANPSAKVSVKLVAEAGVGTIAAGVAKGYAEVVQISGHEGGTGASPLSSVKNAGAPWELGVAEAQQVLVSNNLRDRVTIRTDGMMRTGRDVIVAALLGAEEYGFGTASLIAIGCTMARQCHLNTCPVGVATQDPKLREKFKGTPENLIRYFFHVAEEIREILASIGAADLNEITGRSDLLYQKELPGHPKANSLDLSPMLKLADPSGTLPRYHIQERNDRPEPVFDDALIPTVKDAIENGRSVQIDSIVRNRDRTIGGRIAGMIARKYGSDGLPDELSVDLDFEGSAGQSFGAWCVKGMKLSLQGDANDYVGKGLNGADLVLRPHQTSPLLSHENVIMGNAVLYGAISGRLFAAGRAGERFAVRNSGAWTVVEGTGNHPCEYMTGGVVVILGEVGRNLGAGMSGGIVYVLDLADSLPVTHNSEMVQLERVHDHDDVSLVRELIERHILETESSRAKEIIANWDGFIPRFWKVSPKPVIAPAQPREIQRQQRDAMLSTMRSKVGKGSETKA